MEATNMRTNSLLWVDRQTIFATIVIIRTALTDKKQHDTGDSGEHPYILDR
jgi:hypothetical protein